MKILLIIFLMAATTLYANDLTTKSGKIYKDYKVNKATAQGLIIFHLEGAATVPFADLPDNIRAQYADTEKKLIEQEKILLEQCRIAEEEQAKMLKLKAISRPIILIPERKINIGVVCKWNENNIRYGSIEEALKDADPMMKKRYMEAKKDQDDFKRKPLAQRNAEMNDARMLGALSLMEVWIHSMNASLNYQYPYPKSAMIVVQDLPENTISKAQIPSVIYCIGTMERDGVVHQLYTIDKNKALKFIQGQTK
jgi:hypothetical protein